MNDWELYNEGLPPMSISDIEINNVENHLLISTYGRGFWRSPVHEEAMSVIENPTSSQRAHIYPNPTSAAITLDFDLDEPSYLYIYKTDGTLLQSNLRPKIIKGTQVDLSSYPAGTYILRVISNNHHINGKILKQ